MEKSFDSRKLAGRSLRHFARNHAPMAIGVAVATTVLVGALVVGDSVRGSLRGLTNQRLGRIDYAVAPGTPFSETLADQLEEAAPLWIASGSLGTRRGGAARRANRVSVVGCDKRFWGLGDSPPEEVEGLVLTEGLARELGVAAGDEVVVRIGKPSATPADSPLGEKSDATVSRRVEVAAVLEPRGLVRFGLTPSQSPPRNAFLPLAWIQDLLDEPSRCNTLVAAKPTGPPPEVTATLSDFGLSLLEIDDGLWQIESSRLVLSHHVVAAAEKAFGSDSLTPVVAYLANSVRFGELSTPYSTVVASKRALGEGVTLRDDETVINSWLADDLGAAVGDTLRVAYYEPESTHGVLREAPPIELRVAGVVPLRDAQGRPTAAADPNLVPEMEGVTDADSINDWDLPFELVEEIRQQDEDYWDNHTTTPKLFVSLELAKRLWATRWGDTSLVRIRASDPRAQVEKRLLAAIDPAEMGFGASPVKRLGLEASAGSTPFDVLFLLFSGFLIASAALLISLLVRLAVDARGGELGLLRSVGWEPRRVRRQLMRELLGVVVVGALLGGLVGVAYAAALLWGLRTIWIDAIVTPFLSLHLTPMAILGGLLGGVGVGLIACRGAVAHAAATEPRRLLAGGDGSAPEPPRAGAWRTGAALGCATLAGVTLLWGGAQRGETAAGAFFACGGLLLAAGLLALRRCFDAPSPGVGLSLTGLARRNIARRPGRSLLTIGLIAAAAFLIFATSAFRLPPTEEGTGGFELVATSDQPIHHDMNTGEGRIELGFGRRDADLLAGAGVYGFRVAGGEDASCRNLYQARQPRVLGLTDRFLERGGFAWAEAKPGFADNPWRALSEPSSDDGAIPVVIDFNTAVYALKLYGGVGSRLTIRDAAGEPIELEVVGLLKNSLLQGDLLMSEASLLRCFPQVSGQNFFLIDSDQDPGALSERLEDRLSYYGFDAEAAATRLAGFLAVQNTYLSTFQALGALGLLLGAVGVAVAQFRNLAERRGELALMRAEGFGRRRLGRLVLQENLLLLFAGLALGGAAAAATLAPLAAASDARPPWAAALALVAATALIGLVAGRVAVGRALDAPLTPALRGE